MNHLANKLFGLRRQEDPFYHGKLRVTVTPMPPPGNEGLHKALLGDNGD